MDALSGTFCALDVLLGHCLVGGEPCPANFKPFSIRMLFVLDATRAVPLCNTLVRKHRASFSGMRRWLQFLGRQ